MANHDRVIKLLGDLKEWKKECFNCIHEIEKNGDKEIKKYLLHGIRAYFLDFHILCEDYISITLKELKKYKIDISAIEGMEIIKDSNVVSEEFLKFYIVSRRLRNRLAHRYKLPEDEVLLSNIADNIKLINDLEVIIEKML